VKSDSKRTNFLNFRKKIRTGNQIGMSIIVNCDLIIQYVVIQSDASFHEFFSEHLLRDVEYSEKFRDKSIGFAEGEINMFKSEYLSWIVEGVVKSGIGLSPNQSLICSVVVLGFSVRIEESRLFLRFLVVYRIRILLFEGDVAVSI
jgi:hypothetical protein